MRNQDRFNFIPNTKLKDYFTSSPVYIFHHFPKCGGTSVANALNRWFMPRHDYPKMNKEVVKLVGDKRKNLSAFRSFQLLCGHFLTIEHENILFKRYPEILDNPKYKVFAFIRDPLDRAISNFYYMQEKGTWEGYLDNNIKDNLDNYLRSGKVITLADNFGCNDNNYKKFIDERYFFVGLFESLNNSLNLLADIIGKKKVALNHLNKTTKRKKINEIDKKTIDWFKEKYELDYNIYNYCTNRFNEIQKNVGNNKK